MSASQSSPEKIYIKNAIQAYQEGQSFDALRWSIKAILHQPNNDAAWVILAAVSPPEKAIQFLNRALTINPKNEEARRGIKWALQRSRHQTTPQPTKPIQEEPIKNAPKKEFSWVTLLFKKLWSTLLILISIAIFTIFLLKVAEMGKNHIPFEFPGTLQEIWSQLVSYFFNHPQTYVWKKITTPFLALSGQLFRNSAALLIISLLFAALVGSGLGITAARLKKRNFAPIIIFLSTLGISLPSFLIAMLLWVLDFRLYRWFGLSHAPFPPQGFGWDLHLVMPALVLAARPLAQVMQITYVTATDVLKEDFIRTGYSKGLSRRKIINTHVYRNILIPVLTTLGTSLRFSLASLPVVESFFNWPGLGLSILQAINLDMPFLVVDLMVTLGLFFLLTNTFLDFVYPMIDPRIRTAQADKAMQEDFNRYGVSVWFESMRAIFQDFITGIKLRFKKYNSTQSDTWRRLPPLESNNKFEEPESQSKNKISLFRILFTNIPLILGSLFVIGFIILVVFGKTFPANNPYETNTMLILDGVIQTPPFKPSTHFPWGSDIVGRDIQALVLAGASQTLTLALIATIARIILGTLLGIISGWWTNSWMDRLVKWISSVWAAFPETIFTMLIILALGIQQGRSVFIIALCLVGWGEITQYIRAQVISQKPKLHIEAARSIGARPGQILTRQIFPHLVPSILVLFVLQMGGILMLLAELGFLNIFVGGGFKAQVAEEFNMTPVIFYFSDIPEWGALLANIRDWWRSYPWLAWYPGLFFFLAIFTFNLWGEGLRRLIQETRINLNRLFNRYTVSLIALFSLAVVWILNATSPLDLYKEQALLFDTERAMQTIEELSSTKYAGRMSSHGGGDAAAEYIAAQMEEIGLFPGASNTDYLLDIVQTYPILTGVPKLSVTSSETQAQFSNLVYRKDFMEYALLLPGFGSATAPIIGVALGEGSDVYEQKGYREIDESLEDKIVLIQEKDANRIFFDEVAGLIIISENNQFDKKYLYPDIGYRFLGYPILQVSTELGNRLLNTCGSSLENLQSLEKFTAADNISTTPQGSTVNMIVPGKDDDQHTHKTVLGYIPGTGANQPGQGEARTADQQVIVITAYYDGLGVGPDGQVYPGANDNASGVATMLEIARAIKNGPYPPEKTILFVAWSPGEHQQGFSLVRTTEATNAFSHSHFEAVIEISAVGSGSGDSLFLDDGSSYKLSTVFSKAAKRLNTEITNRGVNPHSDIPIRQGYGERTALTAYLSWDGSDWLAHTTQDKYEIIDPEKIKKSGQTILLVTTYISRETDY